MPSVSRPQHNLMEAVAHDPGFAKKVGISQKVGKDFAAADKATGKYRHSGSSPKNQSEHMAKRRKQGLTYKQVAAEHKVSKSTAHRRVGGDQMLRQGYNRLGRAYD